MTILCVIICFRVMASILGPLVAKINVNHKNLQLKTFQMSLLRSLYSNFDFYPLRPSGPPAAILEISLWRKTLKGDI